MKAVLQIVPYLPPSNSGVGDYALILARGLREKYDLETTFAVAHPNAGQSDLEGFPVVSFTSHASGTLRATLTGCNRVLLHYVGYGYQKRGCPWWLMRGLSNWKKQASDPCLVTMFHELYASGPPWRSSFWMHPVQKYLCASLAGLSDSCASNIPLGQQRLRLFHQKSDIMLLPVFSNVGEPEELTPWGERGASLALFGGEGNRRTAVTTDRTDLEAACRALNIRRILDIGPGILEDPAIDGVSWQPQGALPPREVSICLQESLAGFVSYPRALVGKSGIVAAYQSHGLPVILPRRYLEVTPYAVPPDHSILHSAQLEGLGSQQLLAASHASSKAYELRSISRHVDCFSKVLE